MLLTKHIVYRLFTGEISPVKKYSSLRTRMSSVLFRLRIHLRKSLQCLVLSFLMKSLIVLRKVKTIISGIVAQDAELSSSFMTSKGLFIATSGFV